MHHSIDIENLSFAYPDGHAALRSVSLHIAPGEKVALVGPNGAGKSTLILHLNGILTGKADRLHICGLDVDEKILAGCGAQSDWFFRILTISFFPTVYEDVAFGPLYQGLSALEVDERVQTALAAVGMGEYARRVSYHLSAGEKKRIAIATVLSMRPEVLVLDEPTAGLDPRARRSLIHLLRDLPITMLVSTHDLAMVKELFPRQIVMDSGEIVADGPTPNLLDDIPLLEAHGLERP